MWEGDRSQTCVLVVVSVMLVVCLNLMFLYINVDSLYHWSCVSVYLKTQVVGGVCIYFCTMMLFDVFHYAMYVA
jgi:hypothetical protein